MDVGQYIGLPFRTHGRTRDGLDCWGLVRLVLAEQWGLAVPCYGERYRDARRDAGAIAREIAAERARWGEVGPGGERPGDVALLRIRGLEAHVGLVVAPADRLMLHIEADGIGACLEGYDTPLWRHRLVGFWRPPGMPA